MEKSGNKDSIHAENVRNFPRLFAADEGQRRSLPWDDQEGRIISDHEDSPPPYLESFFSEQKKRLQRRANEIDVDTSTESRFGSSTVDNTVLTPAQQRQQIQETQREDPVDAATRRRQCAMCSIIIFVLFGGLAVISSTPYLL